MSNICGECGEFIGLPQHHRLWCLQWDFIPEPDSLKSEQQLHDEVFDPRISDLEYFHLRKLHHGL